MAIKSYKRPAVIGVYNTNGSSYIPMRDGLQRVIKPDENIVLEFITGKDIQSGWLRQKHVIGYAMPGRRAVKDYLDELSPTGLQEISYIADLGTSVMAECAGAFALSKVYRWKFKDNYKEIALPHGLFDGVNEGPIMELYEDAYQKISTEYVPVPSNVAEISLAEELQNSLHNISVEYGGGGRFYPSKLDQVKILARHENTVDRTPAIIQFSHGKGDVIFSNVHPEITARRFKYSFLKTDKAIKQPEIFARHIQDLDDSHSGHNAILRYFIDNCIQNPINQSFQRLSDASYALVNAA